MKFSLSWLKDHLDTSASLNQICEKLTSLGLEVEGVEDLAQKLKPFIIGHIVNASPHPNADRLKICIVDTGSEKLQVVCGAPNARQGIKIVLARPGDVMPDTGETLKKGTIRGIESEGMICAIDELGIGDAHDGILELAQDAPVGGSFASFSGYDDPIIDINLTPNRPDCAGVRGIARDLAAAGLGVLKTLDIKPYKGVEPSKIKIALALTDPKRACPFFVGRLIRGIQNKPSPLWLQRRLTSVGLRPISALVDITNYLTFDCARPLHVFDAKKIKGSLVVREAIGGESFEALNDKTYHITKGMTVICDDTRVISLGGIMGGSSTACDDKTTDVFIEAAYFDPIRTALTGRALQISSDARYRFERGVDPSFTVLGLELATKLILEICGTEETVISTLEIAGADPFRPKVIALDATKCQRLTGISMTPFEQENILKTLGFKVSSKDAVINVTPPSWRPDIDGAADLVEELIRVKGYDYLPVTSLPRPYAVTKSAIDLLDIRAHLAKRALASQGLMETVTWSFMSSGLTKHFGGSHEALQITNPVSSDLDVMRPSIYANLIMAAKRNADRGFADVALFEIGPIFKNATPEGQVIVATALRAGHTPRHWTTPSRPMDAFDAKADALATLASWGAPISALHVTRDAPPWYHPGRSGVLRLGNMSLAIFGEIHPHILKECDANGPMVGCEIFLNALQAPRSTTNAKPLLKIDSLQPISRDFAFLVDKNIPASKLMRAIKDADKNLIREVNLFDVYEGDKIAADKKSIALSVWLQPTQKSMTDTEIEAIAHKITEFVCKATGAVLRG